MATKRLKLPVGIQTFEEVRKGGYVYIDKTQYLVQMIDTGKIFFFARPRRFGKSLSVSTIEALFSGDRELFKGLAAEEFMNRPDYHTNPVIRLDMSDITTGDGIESMKESIINMTKGVARKLDVEVSSTRLCGDLLSELITAATSKYGQKAVVLIDEYDRPYTDFVKDPEMANKVRDVLRDYYVRIKTKDEYVRFTFITGISKFARFGVFSTLNSPKDISMSPKYAAMCGYTEEEIIRYFPDYLEETAAHLQISISDLIEKMRHFYNGFSFDSQAETRLYNPYSTLQFFDDMEFSSFWIESGGSKMMADYMKNKRLTVEQFRNFPVTQDFVRNPGDMDTTPPEGFLYQAGYLSLRPGRNHGFLLDYPNTEVLNAMSGLVIRNFLQYKDQSYSRCQTDLLDGIIEKDCAKVIDAFNRLLASIPYDDYAPAAEQLLRKYGAKMNLRECLYRTAILSFLQGCGVVVASEMHTNKGRADLVVAFQGVVWVIEIKVAYEGENAATKAGTAYRQIINRNYAKPYPDAIRLGIAIDDTLRQITHTKSSLK